MAESLDFTDIVRDNVKQCLLNDRSKKKTDLLSKLRHVDFESDKSKEINIDDIVAKLKKHGVDVRSQILSDLKYALSIDASIAIKFLKHEGALHALVGLILGKDPFLQLLAVECCCNLSLGNSKTCYQVAKAATPYFITTLGGLNYSLMGTTLWAVGNICGTGTKCCSVLISQGIVSSLISLVGQEQVRESVLYTLLLLTKTAIKELSETEACAITKVALEYYQSEVLAQWLCFHCCQREVCLNYAISFGIIKYATDLFVTPTETQGITESSVVSSTAVVRIIACLATHPKGALELVLRWPELFSQLDTYLNSEYRHLAKETLWMFSNLVINLKNLKEIHHISNKDLMYLARKSSLLIT